MKIRNIILYLLVALLSYGHVIAQTRVGTTASNFLELGYDPIGIAMGNAYVSRTNNLSAIHWNPAGLAFLSKNKVSFSYEPWLVNSKTYNAVAGIVLPSFGTFAIGGYGVNYGKMEVTTLELQEGTGENFTPKDLAVNLSYGRQLTDWFGFGSTIKYINSSIYHCNANAFAADLGFIIKTSFLSPTGEKRNGMNIGMSMSNYGTKMRYRGLDLMRSIDIAPNEGGNYEHIKADLRTESWELPLIFRVGVSINPIVATYHNLTLEMNALHPNNNNESVNLGGQYTLSIPGRAKIFLRGGYRGLFLEDSEFGPTYGIGLLMQFLHQKHIQFDFAYRDIGILGHTNVMGISVAF